MRDHTCSTYTQISHIIIMMMKRKSLHVQAGGLSILWFLHMTKVTVCMYTREFITICLCMDGLKVEDIRGILFQQELMIMVMMMMQSFFFFFIPSSGQSVSQCLLTKHRYRLQLNILIISLN